MLIKAAHRGMVRLPHNIVIVVVASETGISKDCAKKLGHGVE